MLSLKAGGYTANDFKYLLEKLASVLDRECKIPCAECPHKWACKDLYNLCMFIDDTIAEKF